MKNNILFPLILLLVSACGKIKEPEPNIIDRNGWLDAACVTDVSYVSHSGTNLFFEAEVAAMKNAEIILDYPDSAFYNIYGLPFNTSVIVDSVYTIENTGNTGFQNILLIDETTTDWLFVDDGSFLSALYRIKKLSQGSNVQFCGFGFFARNEVNNDAPVHFFRSEDGNLFDHTEQEIMQYLSQNYQMLGQGSGASLYDAINAAADELIANPLSSNRSITVVSGNPDDGNGSISLTALITKCQSNNIQVNMIFQSYVSYNPYKLAIATGGFISEINSTPLYDGYRVNTARTVAFHNYDLVQHVGKRYKIKAHINRSSNWTSGQEISAYFLIDYYLEFNSPYFEDDLIDDLDIHHKLPVYLKIP